MILPAPLTVEVLISHRPCPQQDVRWRPVMADHSREVAGILWFVWHCAGCAYHEGPRDPGEHHFLLTNMIVVTIIIILCIITIIYLLKSQQ